MHHLKNTSFILLNLLIVSSLFSVPCSTFLFERIDPEADGDAPPVKQINLGISIGGGALVIGSEIVVRADLE